MESDIIKISHLTKNFGDIRAVNDLNFKVKRGETLDCNPQFHGNVVNTTQMILIMAGSIMVLGVISLLITRLPEKENR